MPLAASCLHFGFNALQPTAVACWLATPLTEMQPPVFTQPAVVGGCFLRMSSQYMDPDSNTAQEMW